MSLLHYCKLLYNHVHESTSGASYIPESIDWDEFWKVILSASEESAQSLSGIAQLLDAASSEGSKSNSIVAAVKKFSDHNVSIKERIKSADGLIGFLSYFDEKLMMSVIKSFIDILQILCKSPETIPFKMLCKMSILGAIDVDLIEKIYQYLINLPREDLVPAALMHSLLYTQYVGTLDDETELELETVLNYLDNLILTLAYGTPIECAAACHLEHTIGYCSEDDPNMLLREILEPAIKLACNSDPALAKQGHEAVKALFYNRICISYSDIVTFLGYRLEYKNIHYFYKECSVLAVENDDEDIDDETNDYVLSENSQKKIMKFLHRIIVDPSISDHERAEALMTVYKLTTSGIDIAQNYYEEETEYALQLVNAGKKEYFGFIAMFFTLPSVFGNTYIHKKIMKVIPTLYNVAIGPMENDKICGVIGEGLAQIVVSDEFAEFRPSIVKLILKLFQSPTTINIYSATMMVSHMKTKIDEHDAAQIYKDAITAVINCKDEKICAMSVFKSLKTLIKRFPVDEKTTLDFLSLLLEGKIAVLNNIPLFYHEENLEIYNYIKFIFLKFKSAIPAYSSKFVEFFVTAINDMKLSALIPVTAMIQKQGLDREQCSQVLHTCYNIFDQLGEGYNNTLTQAAVCVMHITKIFPDLVSPNAVVPMMKDVVESFEDSDSGDFKGTHYFFNILMMFLINAEEQLEDEDTIMEMIMIQAEDFDFDPKEQFTDETLGRMSLLAAKMPDSSITGPLLVVMCQYLLSPRLLELHNISSTTEKEMRSNVRKVAAENSEARSYLYERIATTYGAKRNLNRLLKERITSSESFSSVGSDKK